MAAMSADTCRCLACMCTSQSDDLQVIRQGSLQVFQAHMCRVFLHAESFDKVLEVDKSAYTVKVQAGLKVLSLLRWADQNGMATEVGAPTNYAELTIGGVISANGHGTGSNVTSSMVRAGLLARLGQHCASV